MKQNLLLSTLLFCSYASATCQDKKPNSEAPRDRINYPSNFQVEGGVDLFIAAEYLYWTANESGLYFAQTGANTGPLAQGGSINFHGQLKRIHPEWQSGARIGVGLNFPKEGYDLAFYWTWFSADGHGSAHSSSGNILPLWGEPDFSPFANASQAHGKWDMTLNVFDLEWGRSSWFGGHFSLRPFFGVRGVKIDQDLKNRFTYATTPSILGKLHASSDYGGIGLRAGLDTRFALPHGFAVYGLGSGSLLYGKTNADLRVHEDAFSIATTNDKFWNPASSLQLGLGFGWDTHFSKDRLHLEFHVGWEQNIWFNVNQMNHYLNTLSTGYYFKESSSMSTQGIVAGGRFDF